MNLCMIMFIFSAFKNALFNKIPIQGRINQTKSDSPNPREGRKSVHI